MTLLYLPRVIDVVPPDCASLRQHKQRNLLACLLRGGAPQNAVHANPILCCRALSTGMQRFAVLL
jgi:hypothetical protein